MSKTLPPYSWSAASIRYSLLRSNESGRPGEMRSSVTRFRVQSSRIPDSIPKLRSSTDAPALDCRFASVRIVCIVPFSISSVIFFLPVGLMRSPMTTGGESWTKMTFFVNAEMPFKISFSRLLGFLFPNLLTRRLICSGPVPQHPPIMFAPSSKKSSPYFTNSSGPILYTVFPLTISGIPALGFMLSNFVVMRDSSWKMGSIPSGPSEQFIPSASTSMSSNDKAKPVGSVPISVLPSLSNVRFATMKVSGALSLTARRAALSSRISEKVSSIKRSTPFFLRTFTSLL
ncbi:hypothetical protein ES703_27587 [subsurface metagenome]